MKLYRNTASHDFNKLTVLKQLVRFYFNHINNIQISLADVQFRIKREFELNPKCLFIFEEACALPRSFCRVEPESTADKSPLQTRVRSRHYAPVWRYFWVNVK